MYIDASNYALDFGQNYFRRQHFQHASDALEGCLRRQLTSFRTKQMTCHAVGNEALFYAQYFPVAKKKQCQQSIFLK